MSRRAFALAAMAAPLVACERRVPPGRIGASLWFAYGGKNREVLLSLVQRFNASQDRYHVAPVYQGDYFECLAKVRTALAAGVAPALTHVVGEVVPYLADAGVLEPLDARPGAQELELVHPLSQAGAFSNGPKTLFAVPFNRSTPLLYANADVLAKDGVAIPTTWDELRAAAKVLTRRGDSPRYGFEVPVDWWFWAGMAAQGGGRLVGEDGSVELGGEPGARAVELLQALVHEDQTMRPPPGRDYNAWQATNQDFLAGRAAMVLTSTAFLRYFEESARFRVKAAPVPRFEKPAVPTGGTFFTILRTAPEAEKEVAWAFLRFMCAAEQAAEWAERTGYLPVTEGAVRLLEKKGFYAAHPNDTVARDQLGTAMAWPWSKDLFRVQREIVAPVLEAAVLTRADARTVLRRAREEAVR